MQLGVWHFQKDEWGQAIKFLRIALDKGRLEHPEAAYQVLGDCYQCMGNERMAQEAFLRAEGEGHAPELSPGLSPGLGLI
ncbi:hypothetical protein HBA55_23405 [Pseudomaricurvus alkylphenolicus]|uniref:tetratricopeptide repeat protein n=1 Tax=Pseudomaricurvus alkylphenolicus TaxID=1306991 RepID=UPI001424A407|nr:hypothetical protein [Pseudomaricurvus alkylphenolicus]NIB42575.1 hypothetical protein [Pseudomaricurvus alkylphenolicus]